MKILYVAAKHDYGEPSRGFSFQHYNFFDTLLHMGNEIVYFDFIQNMKKFGKKQMNMFLLETFKKESPDLVFFFLSEFELDKKIISQVSRSNNSVTLNWFADDHWRFENYSRYWAACFNWVVTTDRDAVPRYVATGFHNVILSQWACNHFLYQKREIPEKYDVTFIGQAYGDRKRIIKEILNAGIAVETRGKGWNAGRVSQEEMIQIFNGSSINLNLANASVKFSSGWLTPIDRFALYNRLTRQGWRKLRSSFGPNGLASHPIQQIKGRTFEVPGCGGFLLTDYVKGIEDFYQPGQEIECYNSTPDLITKIKYYLKNTDLRQKIALKGYQKTLERHTYVHRFNQIFRQIGLKSDYSLESSPGSCREVNE